MKTSRLLAILLLCGFSIGSMGSGCSTGTINSPIDDDSCGPFKQVCKFQTLRPGLINGESDFFELETPEARNDCEATYFFYFRWADPAIRATDPEMPPLDDLAHAFQPGGEFAYFPHPAPSFDPTASKVDCSSNELPGQGWWVITFHVGNRFSALPTTRYYVRARLDPTSATTGDDTEVLCYIKYYDKPKKN